MRRIRKGFAVVLLLVSLTGCQAMTGKTAGQNVDDANLTASVKANLVADKAANLTRIDVDTNGGIVYLNGTVQSPQEKARAEQLALQVQGVKKVVNNLQVARG
ncbi:MAG: BON domain-containing protein [Candidatus Binatia bacterium]